MVTVSVAVSAVSVSVSVSMGVRVGVIGFGVHSFAALLFLEESFAVAGFAF